MNKKLNDMKRLLLIIISFVLITELSAQNSTQTIVDSAFNSYMRKDYDEAAKLYKTLLNQNYSSADLYYNLANCYMQNDCKCNLLL